MHDDVRLDDVDDVVDGLPELVRRVVVEEPVRRLGRHVVGDLGHELAMAGAVAVVVASGEPIGLVEREAVLAVERGSSVPASASSLLAAPKAWSSTTIVTPAPELPLRCSASAPVSATPCETIASAEDVSASSAPATAGERRTPASAPAASAAFEAAADPALRNAPRRTTAARAAARVPAGVTKTARATAGPDARARAAVARVPNVMRAANAHGSASFVRIGASLADAVMAIGGTVAKRTSAAGTTCAEGARGCRIRGVPRVREQRR